MNGKVLVVCLFAEVVPDYFYISGDVNVDFLAKNICVGALCNLLLAFNVLSNINSFLRFPQITK